MTRLLRWIHRCLGIIQISLIISYPEDAKMVRLDLKFHKLQRDVRRQAASDESRAVPLAEIDLEYIRL